MLVVFTVPRNPEIESSTISTLANNDTVFELPDLRDFRAAIPLAYEILREIKEEYEGKLE